MNQMGDQISVSKQREMSGETNDLLACFLALHYPDLYSMTYEIMKRKRILLFGIRSTLLKGKISNGDLNLDLLIVIVIK